MLKSKVLAIGAGGNGAGIELLKSQVIQKDSILLVNSTSKDIPAEYEDISAVYSRAYGGAAKERSAAKELCLDALRNDKDFVSKVDSFISPDTEKLFILTTTSGGTGSGSTTILAKYFASVIRRAVPKLKITIFAITGFETDIRELQNTLEFFQEIDPEFTVQAISNKKFKDEGLTMSQAEIAADKEIAKKVAIQMGLHINYVDSRHNIDESDLYKLSSTPGFMVTFRVEIGKLKNVEHFNKLVTEAIENDKSLDIPRQSISRLGVITNISEKNEEFIDYQFPSLRAKLGNYYELFIHDNKYDEGAEYVEFIASGLEMPIDELKDVYEKYREETQNVVKEKDGFFDFMKGLSADAKDNMFDSGVNLKTSDEEISNDLGKDDFFSNFMVDSKPQAKDKEVSNPVITIKNQPMSKDLKTAEIKNKKARDQF